MSPKEISMSINRKYARIKTDTPNKETNEDQNDVFDLQKCISPTRKLTQNERSLSPIMKRQKEAKRRFTAPSEEIASKEIKKSS